MTAKAKQRSQTRNLILILGDQLSETISSLRDADPVRDVVLMCEVADETTYVRHHKKKIVFVLSAMRHFAEALTAKGFTVDYVKLDDPQNSGSFTGELKRAAARWSPAKIIATEPGEWRVLEFFNDWERAFGLPIQMPPDDRFLATHEEFDAWAEDRQQLRMEFFYREMRRKTGYLMDGGKPEGGQWNFDHDNRKPAKADLFLPKPKSFPADKITSEVIALVSSRFGNHIGSIENFWFAVTRADALIALDDFIEEALPQFGDYQDAMLRGERFLYHSVLSAYINAGLLEAREVCEKAEAAYRSGQVPLNSAEGFIRQIIGWREYVRGIYWREMPGYVERNFFDARRKLPDFYWTGETEMLCLREAITQTIDEAYAHHIQRLMITGNFALLAGIDPHEVHEWYLAVYADAYEWVEAPNTIGMSQFADGGLLASKPYAAGGNYINKMSDYCKSCRYDVKKRTGPDACPFNALYWHFLDRNRKKLSGLQRLRTVYSAWDRMSDADRAATIASSDKFLAEL